MKILKADFGKLPFEKVQKETNANEDDGYGMISPLERVKNQVWLKKRELDIQILLQKKKEEEQENSDNSSSSVDKNGDSKKSNSPVEKQSVYLENVLHSFLSDLWSYYYLHSLSEQEV